MSTVWFRETINDQWRKAAPYLTGVGRDYADKIADRYNPKYDHGMWWVTDHGRPPEDATPWE